MNEKPEKRFARHISRLQDPTLIILRGHLLMEEQLELFLSLAARAPGELKEARLTYSQKLQLVRALSGDKGDALDFAAAINKIRNLLAHRLDTDDLVDRIDAVLRQHNPNYPRNPSRRQRASWLTTQVAFVCGALNGMARGFHVASTQAKLELPRTAHEGGLAAR